MLEKVDERDLKKAIEYYNRSSKKNVIDSDLTFIGIELKNPIELLAEALPDYVLSHEKGWLKSFKESDWVSEIEKVEVRDFKRIIHLYLEKRLPPVVQINGKLSDGFGRCIFFQSIGKDIPVAVFSARC